MTPPMTPRPTRPTSSQATFDALQRRLAVAAAGLTLILGIALWQFGGCALPAALAAQDGAPAPLPPVAAPPAAVLPAQEVQVAATAEHPAYTLYTPEGPLVPRTALVVLHGMGSNGPSLAARFLPSARAQDWVVVAPTVAYGDWRNPDQLVPEMLLQLPQLGRLLDAIPAETGVPLQERVLLFGFSRGGQAALRFTLLFPERVHAVASLSAGTYTLPVRSVKTAAGAAMAAPLPYGVADVEQLMGRSVDQAGLAAVRFWIGVGARDNVDGDVPRQWDPFVGKNRVERAQRFATTLAEMGCATEVAVVAGAGHEITGPMVEQAMQFLATASALAQQQAAAATIS